MSSELLSGSSSSLSSSSFRSSRCTFSGRYSFGSHKILYFEFSITHTHLREAQAGNYRTSRVGQNSWPVRHGTQTHCDTEVTAWNLHFSFCGAHFWLGLLCKQFASITKITEVISLSPYNLQIKLFYGYL